MGQSLVRAGQDVRAMPALAFIAVPVSKTNAVDAIVVLSTEWQRSTISAPGRLFHRSFVPNSGIFSSEGRPSSSTLFLICG